MLKSLSVLWFYVNKETIWDFSDMSRFTKSARYLFWQFFRGRIHIDTLRILLQKQGMWTTENGKTPITSNELMLESWNNSKNSIVLSNTTCLWSTKRLPINKNQKHFSLLDDQLAENLVLVFDFLERTKKGQKRIYN